MGKHDKVLEEWCEEWIAICNKLKNSGADLSRIRISREDGDDCIVFVREKPGISNSFKNQMFDF